MLCCACCAVYAVSFMCAVWAVLMCSLLPILQHGLESNLRQPGCAEHAVQTHAMICHVVLVHAMLMKAMLVHATLFM